MQNFQSECRSWAMQCILNASAFVCRSSVSFLWNGRNCIWPFEMCLNVFRDLEKYPWPSCRVLCTSRHRKTDHIVIAQTASVQNANKMSSPCSAAHTNNNNNSSSHTIERRPNSSTAAQKRKLKRKENENSIAASQHRSSARAQFLFCLLHTNLLSARPVHICCA